MKERRDYIAGKSGSYKYCESGIQCVYRIYHDYSGHFYIGCTTDLARRISHHFGDLKRGCHSSFALQKVFDTSKYEDFSFDIVKKGQDMEELKAYELHLLNKNKDNPLLLNSATENNSWVLNPRYDKREWLEKISASAKLRTGENNPFYGKKHTEEAKKKISAVHKGKTNESVWKPVVINGIKYDSLKSVKEKYNIPESTTLHRVCSENPVFQNWSYYSENKDLKIYDDRLLFHPASKPSGLFVVKEKYYWDVNDIMQDYNLKRSTVYYRFKSKSFPEWKKIY